MNMAITKEVACAAIKNSIENGNIPRYIYKYVDCDSAKKIIENNSIKFNSINKFNDPFDGKAYIGYNLSYEEVIKMPIFDSIPKHLKSNIIHQITANHSNMLQTIQLLYSYLEAATSLSCFSKVGDNLLMWAHYAQKHEGLCLKFDISKDIDFFSIPVEIKYKDEFTSYKFSDVDKYILEQYSTKGLDWAYEQELRVLKTNTQPDCMPFNKNALVEISFGCKCSKDYVNEIRRLLLQCNYKDIQLKAANISPRNYKLDFSLIK